MGDLPPSQIPVPINKRSSLTIPSPVMLPHASGSRPTSPLTLAKPNGRTSPHMGMGMGGRRYSLLSSGSRKTSFSDMGGGTDDPTHLKAQIALLQTSLYASHQRILELSQSSGLNTSMTSSPGGGASPLPWTPVHGLMGLPEIDGLSMISTPGATLDLMSASAVIEEDEIGDRSADSEPLPDGDAAHVRGLPHSSSSYDLRSRAITPGHIESPNDKGVSRIPKATVTHALSLHPTPTPSLPSPSAVPPPYTISPIEASTSHLRSPFLPPDSPYSLNDTGGALRRSTCLVGSAASTKVIDSLQNELVNTRGHLERVKQEVRSCQRVIGSLTRQTEDLKDTRERMRVECEGLNNVIARKERLLQVIETRLEVLDRARTAESSLQTHLSTKKALETSTKKSLSLMTAQLTEAQTSQMKAEREASSLKESVKSLRDVWARDVKGVREEWKRGEEKGRREREETRDKHLALVKLIESQSAERAAIQALAKTSVEQSRAATTAFESQIASLRDQVADSGRHSEEARAMTAELAGELTRLRRLMREPRRADLEDAALYGEEPIIMNGTNETMETTARESRGGIIG